MMRKSERAPESRAEETKAMIRRGSRSFSAVSQERRYQKAHETVSRCEASADGFARSRFPSSNNESRLVPEVVSSRPRGDRRVGGQAHLRRRDSTGCCSIVERRTRPRPGIGQSRRRGTAQEDGLPGSFSPPWQERAASSSAADSAGAALLPRGRQHGNAHDS